jgi:preprotein translocase subunit SecB
MTDENNVAGANEAPQQQFAIQRIYVKDVSFESPGAPETFRQEFNPQLKVEMNSKSDSLGEGVYNVDLTVTVTAEQDEKTIYLVELTQSGIFTITGVEGLNLRGTLSAYAPNILFPYARAVITDLVTQGGFPQLNLAPVNFDALFAEQMRREQEQAETPAEETVQ